MARSGSSDGIWRLLVAVDVLLIGAFAVAAALEPHSVLDYGSLDLEYFRGLVPTVLVIVLRASVLWAERRLLWRRRVGAVLASRAGSAAAFFYGGRALADARYSSWWEWVLGGILGYAVMGILLAGIALIWDSMRARRVTDGDGPIVSAEAVPSQGATAAARSRLTRESLLGLIGVFVGVAGLVLNVASVTQLAVAVAAGAIVVGLVLWLTPS